MKYDFITIIKLIAATIVPVLAAIIIYILEKKTKLSKLDYKVKQILIGIVFGGLAILSTVFGIKVEDSMLNVRNASPIIAGLIFGGPSGIIAGVIGGVYRFVATYWGAGSFSQIACSVGCIVAGVFAACCRKFMFNNKKASWLYGLVIGGTTEVFHMLLVFITNMNDITKAYNVVLTCAVPMIVCTSLSVMLSLISISLIGKERVIQKKGKKRLSQVFQFILSISVIVAFVATTVFTYIFQTRIADSNSEFLLSLNLDDVEKDVKSASDDKLRTTAKNISKFISIDTSDDDLVLYSVEFDVSEINIVNELGIIIHSTNSEFIGYDMATGSQSKEFVDWYSERTEPEFPSYFVQSYQSTAYDSSISMKYAAVVIDDGFVQVGYDASKFQSDLSNQITASVANRHVGKNGGIIVCNANNIIVYSRDADIGAKLDILDKNTEELKVFAAKIGTTDCYCMYKTTEGFYLVSYMPKSEVNFSRNIAFTILAFMEVIVLAALFIHIYILLKTLVVDKIHKINKSLEKISSGDLSVNVDVRGNEEFGSLSDDINATVDTLKKYIEDAENRIDKELEFARQIQKSSLPSIFPPYPERKDIDIYATMDTAKEVGGDFYDFYMIDKHHLALLVADVSGKGIPAALFMMKAKTLIKNLAESGRNVDEVLTIANQKLSENNEAEMFVTAWMGILDLDTGILSYSNAGHNPPLLSHDGKDFEYIRTKPNLILAGLDDTTYRINEVQLYPTDRLFIYTDGVTEAKNLKDELYGETRLENVLNKSNLTKTEDICKMVKNDLNNFVGEAEQSDDITMLCFRLDHIRTRHEMIVKPTKESISLVLSYMEDRMENFRIPELIANKVQIATDEIFSNIVYYSKATVCKLYIGKKDDMLNLTFTNNGDEFDYTKTSDPDTKASVEDRQIGGLGIFIVKKTATSFSYEYKDKQNIISISYSLKEE